MSTIATIRTKIAQTPQGEPFTTSSLLTHGPRNTVDQALSRLVKAGAIERITRGVFVRPETNPHVGRVLPGPWKVILAIAREHGEIVQVHGAEAARRLALTTQVPTRPVFLTSGPGRRLRIGRLEVELKHVSPRKLALAGRPAGLALTALWYLGREEVTTDVLQTIETRLSPDEFSALKQATQVMPTWMIDAFRTLESAHADA